MEGGCTLGEEALEKVRDIARWAALADDCRMYWTGEERVVSEQAAVTDAHMLASLVAASKAKRCVEYEIAKEEEQVAFLHAQIERHDLLQKRLELAIQDTLEEEKMRCGGANENSPSNFNLSRQEFKENQAQFEKKSNEYKKRIDRLKASLQGFNVEQHGHAALVSKREAYDEMEKRYQQLKKKEDAFKGISNDVALAQQQVHESRSRLEDMETQFTRLVAKLQL